jgi:protein-L-isoaspartate(D-aspartate) O-methyltransferase
MLNLPAFGSSQPVTLKHHDLIRILSSGANPIIEDPILINAFRQVDRGHFIPGEFKHLAYQDRLLKVAYNEVLTNPTVVAKMVSELSPRPGGKYLHLGSGTGYTANLLAYLAGRSGGVYSIERIHWFWHHAREYSKIYKDQVNLELLYRDGWNGLASQGPFDGIVFSFIPAKQPDQLLEQLAVGGKMIYPTAQHYLRVLEKINAVEVIESQVPEINSYAFGMGKEGVI